MLLSRFQPHPLLAPHIAAIWQFESDAGLPASDLRMIVPNGRPKLIIPYRGALHSLIGGGASKHAESSITVVGALESPATIAASGPIGTIGIEFYAASAHLFLRLPLRSIANSVLQLPDLLGRDGVWLQRQIGERPAIEQKIGLIERFLLQRLRAGPADNALIAQAVGLIERSGGQIAIGQLCSALGYSKRYIDMRFAEQIGIGPKRLATIVRFQQLYRRWGQDAGAALDRLEACDAYYDQAHFIKEFRRFTGFSPAAFTRQANEFGRLFYRA